MKIIIGILLLTCLVGVWYINLDKKLYYFGRNDFERNDLPLRIKPDFSPPFEGGFGLRDEYGFTIAAKGNTYVNSHGKFLIEKVISYCWNNDRLVADIRDVEGTRHLIEFSRKSGTKDELSVNVFDGADNLLSSYEKCFDLIKNEGEADSHVRVRLNLRFVLVILVFGLFWRVIVVVKKK